MADLGPPPASRRARWAVGLTAAAVTLVHLALTAGIRAPIVQPDEGGYLGIARWLVDGTRLPIAPAPYRPGYPVVLAPIALLTDDPLALHRGALVVNALLLGTVVLTAWALARRLVSNADATAALLVAVATSCFGGILLVGDVAMASNLVIPLTLAILLAVVRAWETDRWWRWVLAGALAAAVVGVHPVGVVVAVTAGIATLVGFTRTRWRATVRRLALALAGAVVVAPIVALLVAATRDDTPVARLSGARGTATGGAQDRVGYTFGQITDALHLSNPRGLLVALAGQVLHLTAATAGLVVVAIAAGAVAARQVVRDPDAPSGTRLRALGALLVLGTLAASVLVINPARTVSGVTLLYGRYNEQVVAISIVVGLTALPAVARTTRRLLTAVAGVAVVAVTSALVVAFAWPAAAELRVLGYIDLLGLFGVLEALARADLDALRTVVAVLAVLAVLLVAALLVATRLGGLRAAAVAAAVVFAVPSLGGAVVLVRQSESRANERTLTDVIDQQVDATGARCIGYMPSMETSFALAAYQLLVPDVRFAPVQVGDGDSRLVPRACARFVLARADDRALTMLGYQAVAQEASADDQPVTLYEPGGS